jgi:hypothetical protein
MQNYVGTVLDANLLEGLLKTVWSYNDVLLILVHHHDQALLLAPHHESFPEMSFVLQTCLQWLHRIDGDVALVALASSFDCNGDGHVNSECNEDVLESLNLLVVVLISKLNPGQRLSALWVGVLYLLIQINLGFLGG